MKISLICPTRKRPSSMERIAHSALESTNNRAEILFYVDEDDIDSQNKLGELAQKYPNNIGGLLGPRVFLSAMNNSLSKVSKRDLVFWVGDDVVFETQNWDLEVIKEFEKYPDKVLLVYGNDSHQGKDLATHFIVHRNWIDTLGHVVPSIFPGDWVDNWVTDISKSLGRLVYREDLKFTHYHVAAGTAPMDSTYEEKYRRDIYARPMDIYRDNTEKRESDKNKLKEFINSHA